MSTSYPGSKGRKSVPSRENSICKVRRGQVERGKGVEGRAEASSGRTLVVSVGLHFGSGPEIILKSI